MSVASFPIVPGISYLLIPRYMTNRDMRVQYVILFASELKSQRKPVAEIC